MSTQPKYNASFYIGNKPLPTYDAHIEIKLPKLVCEHCGGYIPTPYLATPRAVILCQCPPVEGNIIDSTAKRLPLESEQDVMREEGAL